MMRTMLIAFTSAASFAVPAYAVDEISSKGVGDGAQIQNFYNGGTDSDGNHGYNYGVPFTNSLVAELTDPNTFKLDGPPYTVMMVEDNIPAYVNIAAGVQYFSFQYTMAIADIIRFYDGINGTGNVIDSVTLVADGNDCPDNPEHKFCKWDMASAQPNIALIRSVDFSDTFLDGAFGNLQFGSIDGSSAVPEAASWAMMITGLGLVGAALRRRRGNALAA